ncbi:MAG TPA: hypothetical protein VJA22_02915 [Patescibacteria group bacterium]|nr:hypothetical protein [Patescibacteria group bacterium]
MKSIRQKIDYQLVPDQRRGPRGYGRKDINPLDGAGIDKIERIVRDIIPIHSDQGVCVIKSIIRIERYYMKGGNEPDVLRVLVCVEPSGDCNDAEMRSLEGTYVLFISRTGNNFRVEVRKYSATEILYQGTTSSLHPKEPIHAYPIRKETEPPVVLHAPPKHAVLLVDERIQENDPVLPLLRRALQKHDLQLLVHRPQHSETPLQIFQTIGGYNPRAIFLGRISGKEREVELIINSRVSHPVVAFTDTPWRNRGFFLPRTDINEKIVEATLLEVTTRIRDALNGLPSVLVVDKDYDRNAENVKIILHEALNLGYCTRYVDGAVSDDGASLFEQIIESGAHIVLLSEDLDDESPEDIEHLLLSQAKDPPQVICYAKDPWRGSGLILRKDNNISHENVHEVLSRAVDLCSWKTSASVFCEPLSGSIN